MSKNKQRKNISKADSGLTATKATVTETKVTSTSYGEGLLFHKQNYLLVLAGLGLIILGYILMAGGKMPDANTWEPDRIYSTRRTLIAPILILAGLGLEVYAVFKK